MSMKLSRESSASNKTWDALKESEAKTKRIVDIVDTDTHTLRLCVLRILNATNDTVYTLSFTNTTARHSWITWKIRFLTRNRFCRWLFCRSLLLLPLFLLLSRFFSVVLLFLARTHRSADIFGNGIFHLRFIWICALSFFTLFTPLSWNMIDNNNNSAMWPDVKWTHDNSIPLDAFTSDTTLSRVLRCPLKRIFGLCTTTTPTTKHEFNLRTRF